jgi:hypothetical protein
MNTNGPAAVSPIEQAHALREQARLRREALRAQIERARIQQQVAKRLLAGEDRRARR